MSDAIFWMILAAAGLIAFAIGTWAALSGWRGWLDLKRLELSVSPHPAVPTTPAARIELADLKERVRKLEAIAAGVDL